MNSCKRKISFFEYYPPDRSWPEEIYYAHNIDAYDEYWAEHIIVDYRAYTSDSVDYTDYPDIFSSIHVLR